MKKFFSIGLVAAVGFTTVMVSTMNADARHRRGGVAAGVAAGIIGGLVIGGAIAHSARRVNRRHCHRGFCHRHGPGVRHFARPAPIIVAPRPVYGGNAHVNWCFSRYRSYREYDNTFKPYRGRRRQCLSPYN